MAFQEYPTDRDQGNPNNGAPGQQPYTQGSGQWGGPAGPQGYNNGQTMPVNNGYSFTPPPGTRPVNKLAYCLFAFFLGSFGAHKFYSGRIGLGVLYILFCWTGIPSIIALIEFILAVIKPADIYGNIWV